MRFWEQVDAGLRKNNLQLHDFGTGQTVLPMPDKESGSYLTSTVICVHEIGIPWHALMIEISESQFHVAELNQVVRNICRRFPELATKMSGTEKAWPKPIPYTSLTDGDR